MKIPASPQKEVSSPMRFSTPVILALASMVVFSPPISGQTTDRVLTQNTFIEVAREVLPAVVSISVDVAPDDAYLQERGINNMGDLFRDFLRNPDDYSSKRFWEEFDPESLPATGAGSGIVIRQDDEWAYALTNAHVVNKRGGDRVHYTINLDSSYYDAEVFEVKSPDVELVGADPLSDIAVIRFRRPSGIEFPPIEFADSDKLAIGEWVLALGNPLELNNSVSQGIVSARNRTIGKSTFEGLIQTDAVINPGNSGGPLVNLDGKIVGINNAIATTTGRWAGVGFAIPGNQAKFTAESLIANGRVARGYLGITMTDLTEGFAEDLHVNRRQGVLITTVHPDTPAENAGLVSGDIITAVNGVRTRTNQDVLQYIGGRAAGEKVTIEVLREELNDLEPLTLSVTLAERPEQSALLAQQRTPLVPDLMISPARIITEFGMDTAPTTINGERGVLVEKVEPGSIADISGLREGDFLLEVNSVPARSSFALVEGLLQVRQGANHLVRFKRDGSERSITLEAPEPQENETSRRSRR
jgi:serine protease Do